METLKYKALSTRSIIFHALYQNPQNVSFLTVPRYRL